MNSLEKGLAKSNSRSTTKSKNETEDLPSVMRFNANGFSTVRNTRITNLKAQLPWN
jgi:hypothetical protein